jgi:two-component system sensor histidine kinase KdpD
MRLSDWIKAEARGIGLALALVGGLTIIMVGLTVEAGLAHGSVLYLIPVMIAATRWGLPAALAAAGAGGVASAFFFYPPLYSFYIKDPQEVVDLTLFVFVAVIMSQLASRLKLQLEISRQREIDMRDLYEFSRRLALAFGVSDIHAAIENHLTTVMQRKVVLFSTARDADAARASEADAPVPAQVRAAVAEVSAGRRDPAAGVTVRDDAGGQWLIRAVSPKSTEYGVIAVNLGQHAADALADLRQRVDTALADATATLERLGVSHAISEARMRSEAEQLREALIGSVSHELRTPLASILGAATVLGAAPALQNERKLKALVHDVRDEAERLNNDIQNLLDATRISSDAVKPHAEWAEPADIINSAIERSRRRMESRNVTVNVPADLPLIHVDPVLVQQALVQIFDNAVKYSHPGGRIDISARAVNGMLAIEVRDEGVGLTADECARMWDRFFRGERHLTTCSGSGLGLWIAKAFIAANGGKTYATSAGAGHGTVASIELPVMQAAVSQMEGDADE